MTKPKDSTKKERIDIRVTPDQKRQWAQSAKEAGLSHSAYICTIMDKATSVQSHEENVTNSLKENQFIHSLLLNANLSDKAKKIIVGEMKKHV